MIHKILSLESSWETIKNTTKPLILYGTGNGADKVLNEFEKLGITISAVAVSQDFVRTRTFRGFTVEPINEAIKKYPNPLIVIGFATCIPDVMLNIRKLAENHQVIMPVVPVFGNTLFNREYVENHIEELEYSRSLLFDEESKRVFDNMVYFQYTGNLSYLFSVESSRKEALTSILRLTPQEHMLDLGAYRGDTIEELISITGGYASVTALEPDQKTFEKLSAYIADKPNVTAYPYAVWSEKTELTFSGGGGRQSTIEADGKYTVLATDVDSLVQDSPVTYLKADVEGVEKEMISGMNTLLSVQKPKLSISCYHRTEDLCTLIPAIFKANHSYKIHLRHHPYIPCWDTNLYCI